MRYLIVISWNRLYPQLRFRNYDQIVDELVKRLESHYGVWLS